MSYASLAAPRLFALELAVPTIPLARLGRGVGYVAQCLAVAATLWAVLALPGLLSDQASVTARQTHIAASR